MQTPTVFMAALAASLSIAAETNAQSFNELSGLGYLQNSSWYATAISGEPTPYTIYQVGSGACAFRLQFNRVEFHQAHFVGTNLHGDASQVVRLPNTDIDGYAVQMTSPACASPGVTSAQFNIDANDAPHYWGEHFTQSITELMRGRWVISRDQQEITFVGGIGNLGNSRADLRRVRIRFDRAGSPSRGRVFIESRSNGAWSVNSTIEISRYTHSPAIWGQPTIARPAVDTEGPVSSGSAAYYILRGQ